MITAEGDDAPAAASSNQPQPSILDPWAEEDPWSRGRGEQWRTDAHVRWQRTRSQASNNGIAILPGGPGPVAGEEAATETLEPDEMTRAMQEAMAMPILDSPKNIYRCQWGDTAASRFCLAIRGQPWLQPELLEQ